MKLLVDSGSTKADWIAIDDNGKVLFTTQTLGLNPEVLNKDEIIKRLDDKFDISQNKGKATHLFFYGAGCGTDRMTLPWMIVLEIDLEDIFCVRIILIKCQKN